MSDDTPARPRRRLRWLRRLGLGLVALVVLAVAGLFVFHRTLPRDDLDVVDPGSLAVADEAARSWTVGDLDVDVRDDSVVIERDGLLVWGSVPGQAFVTASGGEVTWEENHGYAWPTVALEDRLADQTIDEVVAVEDGLRVSGRLAGDGADAAYALTIGDDDGSATIDLDVDGTGVRAVALHSARSDGAAVHGFGEQFDDFDLDGRLVPIVGREQGVGRGTQPLSFLADVTSDGAGGTRAMTYAAMSTFVTEDVRGLRLDLDEPSSHAFAVGDTTDPDRVGLEVWSTSLRADLSAADTPAELVADLRRTAPPPELAAWTQEGTVLGLQGGSDEVRQELAIAQDAGVDVAGVWLQDWTGQRTTSFGERLWWTWQLDENRYPDWADLVADLRADGIRTTTYVNPWLVDAAPKEDESIRNLWAEAREQGFLVEQADGAPYLVDQGGFGASLVDLTNPDAREWFTEVIANDVLGDGVDGFMADFGEGLPFDAELADGVAADLHNRWPALWAETVREGCERADRPDCVTWFRAGSLGMEADTPMFWNGDQIVDFGADDGLASVLLGTFSAGVSGWPLVHSDIGGYTSIDAVVKDYVREPDLIARWAELAAFGTMMRTHEGNRPDPNRQVFDDPASAEGLAVATRLFVALKEYRAEVIEEAQRTGVPAIRHGWLVVPGTDAARVDTQFFLGSSLLVAPVLESGADEVEVVLPPGTWEHLTTGEQLEGDRTVTVDAPLGRPAAFVEVDDPAAPVLRSAFTESGLR